MLILILEVSQHRDWEGLALEATWIVRYRRVGLGEECKAGVIPVLGAKVG